MSVRSFAPGVEVVSPRGMWSEVAQKRKGTPVRASFAKNVRLSPGVIGSRPGTSAIAPATGRVTGLFNWVAPNGNHYVLYRDGTTIRSLLQPSAATSILTSIGSTYRPSFADLDVWVYICGYDVNGNGTIQVEIYDGVNTDKAFRGPITLTSIAVGPDGGDGQCSAGTHLIGFVYQNRSGFAGKPTTTITVPVAPGSNTYPSLSVPTFAVTVGLGTGTLSGGNDHPSGIEVQGVINFAGWFGCTTNHVVGALLYIDGHYCGQSAYGGSRPDAAAIHPDLLDDPYLGFNFSFDTTALTAGRHYWEEIAVLDDGRHLSMGQTNFTVSPGGLIPISIVLGTDSRTIPISVTLPGLTDGGGDSTLYLVMTRADNPNNWYWMPTDSQTGGIGSQPVPYNTPVTLDFLANLSDGDMAASLDSANPQFLLLTQDGSGNGPIVPSFVVTYGNRMCYGVSQTLYVSDIGEPEQITGDQHTVITPNKRAIGYAFPLPGSTDLFLTGDRWTSRVTDNGDVPATWAQPIQVSDALGAPFPCCVCWRTGGNHAWVVTEGGPYFFNGSYSDRPLSYLVSDQWRRVNWSAAYAIEMADDVTGLRLYIAVPLDGALEPTHMFVFDYTNGVNFDQVDISLDEFSRPTFSSITVVKELAQDGMVLWIGPSEAADGSGAYSFRVAVTDAVGASATVDCGITVSRGTPETVTPETPTPPTPPPSPPTPPLAPTVTLSSISLSPASVTGGSSSTGTITLSDVAPAGGVIASVSSDTVYAVVPGAVTIPEGSSSATFPISTSTVTSPVSATITTTYEGVGHTAAVIVIAAPPSVTVSSLAISPAGVSGSAIATGTVTLSGAAPGGGATVLLSSDNGSAVVPSSISVPVGTSTGTFSITASPVTTSATANITASYNSTSQAAALGLVAVPAPALSSLAISPATLTGGVSATGTVVLSLPAPGGGITVSLSSDNGSATVPSSVSIPAGSSSATFTITTSSVSSPAIANITATYGGVNQTAALGLNAAPAAALSSLSISPASVTGTTTATGTVTLSRPAPGGGITVSLSSDNGSATVPGSVSVPAGSASVTFTVTTSTVTTSATANITASYSGVSFTASLTLIAVPVAALSSLSISPAMVAGGTTATGTISLSRAAPAGGAVVSLSSNNAAATVPGSVTVAAGSSSATFTVSTTSVSSATTVTITATYNSVSKTSSVNLAAAPAPALSSLSLSPASVTGGAGSSTGTVTLSLAAPGGGITVALSSNKASATVPTSVTVSAGSSTATFTVSTTTVTVSTAATITATYNAVSRTAGLTLAAAPVAALSSLTINPTSLTGGTASTGTLTLTLAAPTGGAVISLSSNSTAATVPTSVTIPAGSTSATFTVSTVSVSTAVSATITASYLSATQSAVLALAATTTPGGPGTLSVANQIYYDMANPNEAHPHGVPSDYDFYSGPVITMGNSPAGNTAIEFWGGCYVGPSGNPATNTRVNVRHVQVYWLKRSTNTWIQGLSSNQFDGGYYTEDFFTDFGTSLDFRTEPDGTLSFTTVSGKVAHFYAPWPRILFSPSDFIGIVTLCEARLIVADATKTDDRSIARFLVDVGGDYYPSATGAGIDKNPGIAGGCFKYVRSDWRSFAMTTLTQAQIDANPPPINLTGISV